MRERSATVIQDRKKEYMYSHMLGLLNKKLPFIDNKFSIYNPNIT